MNTLGDRMRYARKNMKLTQQAIADEFGIARVSVTQWENNITAPDREKIVRLAALLKCTPDWLLSG